VIARRPLARVAASFSATASPTQFGDYPGGKRIRYVEAIDAHPPNSHEPIPAHRLMDEDGSIRPGVEDPGTDRELCLRMYATMMRMQTLDNVFYDAQRQGRVSFYMTSGGEEGTHVGSALALRDDDEVFAQYREAGVLMWRGFTLQNFADQVRRAVWRGGRTPPAVWLGARAAHRILSELVVHAPSCSALATRTTLGKAA